jgi:hypothetical protein
MIQEDPLFRIPGNSNYHLMAVECGDSLDSPCIDAGAGVDYVLDCDYGLGTIRGDLGAYGERWDHPPTFIGNEDSDPVVIPVPRVYSLSQNYPNPFNPSTTIRYDIPDVSGTIPVKINVYDIRGRLVRKLVDQEKASGSYQAHWDGLNTRGEAASSGVYLYRLKAGEFISTKKMLLIQ